MKEDDIVKVEDEFSFIKGMELDPNRSRQYIDRENVPFDIQRIYHGSDLHVVEQYIDTLDPTLANPLKFAIYRGYTPGEIAEKMGLGVGEIEQRLRTAREIVATHFPQLKQQYTSKQVYPHMRMEQAEHDRPAEDYHHLGTHTQACVDETTFKTQVVLYQKELFSYACNLTRDQELAKDLLQETLCKAMLAIAKKKYTSGNLKGWLMTIMYHDFVNMCRTKKRHEVGSLDTVVYNNITSTYAAAKDVEATLNIEKIKQFVSTLDSAVATIWNLYFLEGHKYREIAKALNITVSTVSGKVSVARQEIKKQFPEFCI